MKPQRSIQFFVPGLPAPAGSKRGVPVFRKNAKTGKTNLGVRVVHASDKTKPWMQQVAMFALEEMQGAPMLSGPIYLSVTFRMPRPKSHFRTGKHAGKLKDSAPKFHTNKPDRTKLLRCLEDAMTGIVWADDSAVCDGRAQKVYAAPHQQTGAEVIVREIGE